jgi:hypothetical protein
MEFNLRVEGPDRIAWRLTVSLDLHRGDSVEEAVKRHVLPKLSETEVFRARKVLFSYAVSGSDAGFSGLVGLSGGEAETKSMPALIDLLTQHLTHLKAASKITDFMIFRDPIDKLAGNLGGPDSLLLENRMQHHASRSLLGFVEAEGPVLGRPDKGLLASDFALHMLRKLCEGWDPREVGKMLKAWLVLFLEICRKNGADIQIDPAQQRFESLENLLETHLSGESSSEEWDHAKSAFSEDLRRDDLFLRRNEVWEKMTIPRMEWICWRNLHLSYQRFYLNSVEEATLTLALANLLNEGRLPLK